MLIEEIFFCKSSILNGFLLFFNPKRKTYKVSLGQSESGPGFHDFDQHFSLANFTPPCNLYFKCIELGAKCKSENVNDLNRFATSQGWAGHEQRHCSHFDANSKLDREM